MKEAIKIKSVSSCNLFKSVIPTSYDIVKAHGGSIELISDGLLGTEFIIKLTK